MQLMGKFAVVRAKTADFTLDPTATRSGTRFTNAGAAGSVTCTLPQLNTSAAWDGYWVEFFGVADQILGFATQTAAKGITINNAAATSLKAQTGAQKIGALLRAVWDAGQSKWHLEGGGVHCTYTVA